MKTSKYWLDEFLVESSVSKAIQDDAYKAGRRYELERISSILKTSGELPHMLALASSLDVIAGSLKK